MIHVCTRILLSVSESILSCKILVTSLCTFPEQSITHMHNVKVESYLDQSSLPELEWSFGQPCSQCCLKYKTYIPAKLIPKWVQYESGGQVTSYVFWKKRNRFISVYIPVISILDETETIYLPTTIMTKLIKVLLRWNQITLLFKVFIWTAYTFLKPQLNSFSGYFIFWLLLFRDFFSKTPEMKYSGLGRRIKCRPKANTS